MREAELLSIVSGLKPSSNSAIDAVYESINVPNFTPDELATALLGARSGVWSIIMKACVDNGLFERTELDQPRHTSHHKPRYFKATPLAFQFAEAHNRLYARLVQEELLEELPLAVILQRSLGGFAANAGLRRGVRLDAQALAEETQSHPLVVVQRALGGFAIAAGMHRRILTARTRLVRAHEF
jgi:hypothetical protein